MLEPEPYRPELVLWIELPLGVIVGHEVIVPADAKGALGRVLLRAMDAPMVGAPRRPQRIRVADAPLAREVDEATAGGIAVEIAPTPELDDLLGEFIAAGPRGDVEPSYLENGRVSAAAVEDLFRAAELIYRLAPWKAASDGQGLRVDIPELGVEGGFLSIIGQLGSSLGLLLFRSFEGFERFAHAADQPPSAASIDLGGELLSLEFERGAEVPASMRREITKHGWPVADANGYPCLTLREPDGVPRPLEERDVRVAAACAWAVATFFADHRQIFEMDRVHDPVSESYTTGRGPTVRLTVPYHAFDLFEDDPSAGSVTRARRTGRNAPCPCGSGRKYKRCHLAADLEAHRAQSEHDELHALDRTLVGDVARYAIALWPAEIERARGDFEDWAFARQLSLHWLAYHSPIDGRAAFEPFLEHPPRRLSRDEREWLELQRRVWLSVWRVVEVRPDEGLVLEDLLSGEVRTVRERLGTRTLYRGMCLLARVVDDPRTALLCGTHPWPLSAPAAAEVARRTRARLRRSAAIPVARLHDPRVGRYLIRRWEEALHRSSEPTCAASGGAPEQLTLDFGGP